MITQKTKKTRKPRKTQKTKKTQRNKEYLIYGEDSESVGNSVMVKINKKLSNVKIYEIDWSEEKDNIIVSGLIKYYKYKKIFIPKCDLIDYSPHLNLDGNTVLL